MSFAARLLRSPHFALGFGAGALSFTLLSVSLSREFGPHAAAHRQLLERQETIRKHRNDLVSARIMAMSMNVSSLPKCLCAVCTVPDAVDSLTAGQVALADNYQPSMVQRLLYTWAGQWSAPCDE